MAKMTEVYEQVFRFESGLPGVWAAVVGGTHGNEMTGIHVVNSLINDLREGRIELRAGTLYLALGNLEAIKECSRGSKNGQDLNRAFSQEILEWWRGGDYECFRARQLADAFKGVTLGIDFHATSKPSEPFIFCQRTPTPADEKSYRYFSAGKVLTDPKLVFAGKKVALDEYFARHGGVGLCYETGFAGDSGNAPAIKREILQLLVEERVLHGTGELFISNSKKEIFELESQIMCVDPEKFRFASEKGNRNFEPFKKGEAVAFNGGEPIVAVFNGVLVFPKPRNLWETNKPAGYLARISTPDLLGSDPAGWIGCKR